MKSRLGAALVLVGWYLMIPQHGDNASAPLSTWVPFGQMFKSRKDCEAAIPPLRQMLNEPDAEKAFLSNRGTHQQFEDFKRSIQKYARCIAADNPRLVIPSK